jgi:hypothetical protein
MSTPHQSSLASAHAPVLRAALPPYAAPAPASAAPLTAGTPRVRPFIPEPWRSAIAASDAVMAESVGTEAAVPSEVHAFDGGVAEVVAEVVADDTMAEVTMSVMEVPERIPPYRPLRPTPIMTPALRTPLYIPSIAAPTTEAAPLDEGEIAPLLLTTAEFAAPLSLRPTLSSVEAVALPDDAELLSDAAEHAVSAEQGAPAPEAVTPPTLATEVVSELPWIEAFLAATPAVPMRSVPTPLVSEIIEAAEPETPAEAPTAEQPADEWPLQEAAEEFRAFSAQLDGADNSNASEVVAPDANAPDALFAAPVEPAPLPAWSDEDLMDIMPIRHSGKTPLSNPAVMGDGDLWAERARKAQEEAQVFKAMAAVEPAPDLPTLEAPSADATTPDATAEEAAHALEVLARRVRAGELMLPSYDPRMGEPAALVAALAALLGVRLR